MNITKHCMIPGLSIFLCGTYPSETNEGVRKLSTVTCNRCSMRIGEDDTMDAIIEEPTA